MRSNVPEWQLAPGSFEEEVGPLNVENSLRPSKKLLIYLTLGIKSAYFSCDDGADQRGGVTEGVMEGDA